MLVTRLHFYYRIPTTETWSATNTYAMAVVLGDGRGVELVEFLLELERPRLLAHLHRDDGVAGQANTSP